MKKQLVLIFAVLLILGLAADVYAQTPVVASGDTQVTLSGELRFRGRIENDYNNTFAETEATSANTGRARYDYKIRLGVLAKVSPKTKMFLQLVSQSGSASYNSHSLEAGKGSGAAKGQYTAGNNMIYELAVRNAWLEHTIADMITIKAGHQPIKLGWGIFYDHSLYGDDAIVVTAKPSKEISISAITSKLIENGRNSSDADFYALALNVKPVKDTEISVDLSYLRDRQLTNLSTNLGANLTGATKQLALYNLGARAKTKIAGLGLKGGVELQRGEVHDAWDASYTDIKFRGMAAILGVSYDITPDMVLDAELFYGSGDDNGTSDNKVKTFVDSRSANTPYTYVYEDTVITATKGEGYGNTMYAKLGAKANLTKDLKAEVRYYYLKAAKAAKTAGVYNFTYANDKKDIGHEVDAYITYKLDKGLVYFVEGGYLFAGDYWKAVTGSTVDPKNPWAVKHGLELEF